MRQIKSKNTGPEVFFRKLLWSKGIRYRKYDNSLPGKPDLSIPRHKIAVFIDGEFWHGRDWEIKKNRLKSNREYWIPKIEANIERDKRMNALLQDAGWQVVRFWESQVKNRPEECIEKITTLMKGTRLYERV